MKRIRILLCVSKYYRIIIVHLVVATGTKKNV